MKPKPQIAECPVRAGLRAWLGTSLTLFTLLVALPGGAAEATKDCSVSLKLGALEIAYGDQKLLVYAFGTNQFKPYVKELYSLTGQNVLLDAPPDHLHHHGLMYAVKINGINFWEETPQAGYQRTFRPIAHNAGRTAAGEPFATFTHLLHWVANQDKNTADTAKAALLWERRILTLIVNEAEQEVALKWRSDFFTGTNAARSVFGGTAYHGLGFRFPHAFDKVGQRMNSAKLPYTQEAKWDVTPAKWSSLSGKVGSGDVLVALFNYGGNKGESKFFSMLNPFAYLSATQNLEQTPIEYDAGTRFHLSYLVAVYAQPKSREFLDARYERWQHEVTQR